MDKVLVIAWKELYSAFTDKARLLFMLGTPLAISLILGLTFGGGSGELAIQDIPLAVVNLDEGNGENEFGAAITSILLSEEVNPATGQTCPVTEISTRTPDQSLDEIFNAVALDDPAAAISGVDEGLYAVAVIIPADFSEKLTAPQSLEIMTQTKLEPVTVQVYGSGANPISAVVTRSITEAVINPFVTGNITIRATLQAILADTANIAALTRASEESFAGFACGFSPDLSTLMLNREALNDSQARSPFEQVLIGLGAAQAVFFSLGTATGTLQSIYEDRKMWILQRLLSSPTPRHTILAGKLVGTLVIVILQIVLLMLALSAMASVSNGQLTFLWGNDLLSLTAVLFAVGLAVSGVAVFVTGIATSQQQASLLGSLVTMGLALLGGAFGFQLGEIAKLSLIYWGVDAFDILSTGSSEIGLHLLVLLLQGSILFILGAWFFNRRIDV